MRKNDARRGNKNARKSVALRDAMTNDKYSAIVVANEINARSPR